MVDCYRIQYAYFVDRKNPEYKGAWNEVHNTARVYTPEDKAVQTPNSDTPYSVIGVDLRTEPLVLSVPAVDNGRFYHAQFIDMYTFNFAYAGTRSTGNGAENFLLAGPRWKGERPKELKAIRCETDFALVVFRTQLFNPGDIENVKKDPGRLQGPAAVALSRPRRAAAGARRPLDQAFDAERGAQLAGVLQRPRFHPAVLPDPPDRARLGGAVRENRHRRRPAVRHGSLVAGAAEGGEGRRVRRLAGDRRSQEAWRRGEGHERGPVRFPRIPQNNYLYRMLAAAEGIYGNSKDEAYYPIYSADSDGQALSGVNRYTLRFAPENMPPVDAFWSLTMYRLPQSLLYANLLNRYLINSPMLPNLKRDGDGGVTLYVQHDAPAKDKETNWLPAPSGPFLCVLRLYAPRPDAYNGNWKKPALQRVE